MRKNSIQKRLIGLTLDQPIRLSGLETIEVIQNNETFPVGLVRSTAYGHTINKTIAYGYIEINDRIKDISKNKIKNMKFKINGIDATLFKC